jgi:hypothetical protein
MPNNRIENHIVLKPTTINARQIISRTELVGTSISQIPSPKMKVNLEKLNQVIIAITECDQEKTRQLQVLIGSCVVFILMFIDEPNINEMQDLTQGGAITMGALSISALIKLSLAKSLNEGIENEIVHDITKQWKVTKAEKTDIELLESVRLTAARILTTYPFLHNLAQANEEMGEILTILIQIANNNSQYRLLVRPGNMQLSVTELVCKLAIFLNGNSYDITLNKWRSFNTRESKLCSLAVSQLLGQLTEYYTALIVSQPRRETN